MIRAKVTARKNIVNKEKKGIFKCKSCLCSIILISLLKKGNETRIETNAHWFEQCIKTKFILKFLKDNCFNHVMYNFAAMTPNS